MSPGSQSPHVSKLPFRAAQLLGAHVDTCDIVVMTASGRNDQDRRTSVTETIICPRRVGERALGPAAAAAQKAGGKVVLLTARQGGVVLEPKAYLTRAAEAASLSSEMLDLGGGCAARGQRR
jgi:hypothetical protein